MKICMISVKPKHMEMKYIQENLIEKQLDRSVIAVDSLTYF